MQIGNRILELRKQNNLSQEQLAEKMGVARQTISKWELGETSPDLEQSKQLSQIFNVSLDDLTNNDIKNILVTKANHTEIMIKTIMDTIANGDTSAKLFDSYTRLMAMAKDFNKQITEL